MKSAAFPGTVMCGAAIVVAIKLQRVLMRAQGEGFSKVKGPS
jgi:hypothetical protein